MGLKILHTADWHLDSPFASFSGEQRSFLRRQQKMIPELAAKLCREQQCDLVLLTGDIFDGPFHRETAALVKQCLAQCTVPVFITPGNHDPYVPGSPWMTEFWPENVHIFTGNLAYMDLPALDCRIYGAGYRSMDCPGLLDGFHAEGNFRYCIGALHGDAVQADSPYCPITPAQVRESGFDYLALGHIHKAGSFRAGETLCAWPGCPMGRGWDETGRKFFSIVTLDDTARVTAVPTELPCFFDLEIDLEETQAEAVLPAAPSTDFYRLTLTGRGTPGKLSFPNLPNLTIRDCSMPRAENFPYAGEDSLKGIFFQNLKQSLHGSDAQQEQIIRLAAKLSRQLLDGKEVTLP